MSTDPLTFLDNKPEPAAPPDTPAPPPEPLTAEPATELPATTEATPPAPPPAPAAPPVTAPAPQETPRIPLPELLNERERRQAAEARARQTEEALQLLIRQQQQAQQPPPDIFQDPNAYLQQQVMAPVMQQMASMRAQMSEQMAAMKHGAETVKEAMTALHQHPEGRQIAAALDADPDPYGKLVAWHKRESILKQIGDDPDAFVMRRYQELAAKQAQAQGFAPPGAPTTPQPYARPAVPPPSLASMPAAPAAIQPGNTAALGPGDRFAHVFKG